MTCVLALDCTIGGFTLALLLPTGAVKGLTDPTPRSSSQLHLALENLLQSNGIKPSDITALALTMGPGSFTGCRIAMAFAEAWQLAQPQVQLVALGTLPTLAKYSVTEIKPVTEIKDGFRVLIDAAGGQAYAQDFNAQGHPTSQATCLPVAEAVQTPLPIAAANLPLLEGVRWSLNGLSPEALLAAAQDEACLVPFEIIYLKPLAYKSKQELGTRN